MTIAMPTIFAAIMGWLGWRQIWQVPVLLTAIATLLVVLVNPLANGEGTVGDPNGYLLLAFLIGVPALSWLAFVLGRALKSSQKRKMKS